MVYLPRDQLDAPVGTIAGTFTKQAFASELDAFATFEEQERGFAPATMVRVKRCLSKFLNWVAGKRKALRKITPEDIARLHCPDVRGAPLEADDHRGRCLGVAYLLPVCAVQALVRACLVDTIDAPHIYKLEGLPHGPRWSDVQRLLDGTSGDSSGDIRDHAMLCSSPSTDSKRRSASFAWTDIDWEQELIRFTAPSSAQTQHYPLVPAAGEAVLRYLREVRPRCQRREVFLTLVHPFRPLTGTGFGTKIHKRFLQLGITPPVLGAAWPSALVRHASIGRGIFDEGDC